MGRFLSISFEKLQIGDRHPFSEGVNVHFGGCQFTSWRLKLSLGVLYRKGGIAKKGGALASCDVLRAAVIFELRLQLLAICDFEVACSEGPAGRPLTMTLHCDLVTRPESPLYCETGVAIPLSHCVSCGIADYRCYSVSGVAPVNQTKERAAHELFTGAFRSKSSM